MSETLPVVDVSRGPRLHPLVAQLMVLPDIHAPRGTPGPKPVDALSKQVATREAVVLDKEKYTLICPPQILEQSVIVDICDE